MNREELKKEDEESPSSDAEGVIRCPCNNNTDHGLMVQCESCEVWLHAICFGLREEKSIPENFFCEKCHPREFKCICNQNTPNGKMIQCSKCSTWQHPRCLGKGPRLLPKPYICPTCDPEGFINMKKEKEKMAMTNSIKKKRKENSSEKFSFMKSTPLKEELERDFRSLIEKTNSGMDSEMAGLEISKLVEKYCLRLCDDDKCEVTFDDLVKALSNLFEIESDKVKYSFGEVASTIAKISRFDQESDPYKGWSVIEKNIYPRSSNTENKDWTESPISLKPANFTIKKMENQQFGLISQERIKANQFITEYLGEVIDLSKMDYSHITGNPHILSNNGMSIDARKFGNRARFIRRSCCPNSEVKEVRRNNKTQLYIYSKQEISENTEITIGFDYPWKTCLFGVECACKQPNCQVSNFFKNRRMNASKLLTNLGLSVSSPPPQRRGSITSPNTPQTSNNTPTSASKQVTSPEIVGKKRLKKEIRDLTNELETFEVKGASSLANLGREERKLAMVMKTFHNMENRQSRKRKKDSTLNSPSSAKDSLPPAKKPRGRPGPKKGSRSNAESLLSGTESSEENFTFGARADESYLSDKGILSDDSLPMSPEKLTSPTGSNNSGFDQASLSNSDAFKRDLSPKSEAEENQRLKFGRKKAWILEYQEESSRENLSENSQSSEPLLSPTSFEQLAKMEEEPKGVVHKFPVKKKMLDSFYTKQEKEKQKNEDEGTKLNSNNSVKEEQKKSLGKESPNKTSLSPHSTQSISSPATEHQKQHTNSKSINPRRENGNLVAQPQQNGLNNHFQARNFSAVHSSSNGQNLSTHKISKLENDPMQISNKKNEEIRDNSLTSQQKSSCPTLPSPSSFSSTSSSSSLPSTSFSHSSSTITNSKQIPSSNSMYNSPPSYYNSFSLKPQQNFGFNPLFTTQKQNF